MKHTAETTPQREDQNTHKRQDSGARHINTTPPANPFHTPNTTQKESSVYVLTLNLTPSISVPLDQMRTEYFPKNLNRTPAHITLFHALPHSRLPNIISDLETITASTRPYNISTGRPFRMRKGVAVRLDSGAESSEHFREELRERWVDCLSEQDRRSWQPHWTVMNKVDEERKVEQAFNTIRRVLCEEVMRGMVVGVVLWRYVVGGQWVVVREFGFGGESGERKEGRNKGEGEGYFDLGTDGRKARSPEVVKRATKGVKGVWRSVTGKKGDRQEVER
jgi:2'-5' RNA ligase